MLDGLLTLSRAIDAVNTRIGKWVAGTHSTHGSGEPPEAVELALAPYEGRVYEILRGDA